MDRIQRIEDDVHEIKKDVKELLKFKWQVIGGSIVISVIITIAFQVVGIWKQ